MKKYFVGLIAIFAAFTCVFAFRPVSDSNSKKLPSLYWFVGQTYTGRQDTHVDEVPLSGCPDAGIVHCEDGYDDNDFNTTGNPASGLKTSATIDDFIRKS
jgi:hypothetical protein